MRFLTQDAILTCRHVNGVVQIEPSQDWVTVEGRRVLVAKDPEGKKIKGCPHVGVGIKPCTMTQEVTAGYSGFIRVDGKSVCLDTVVGLTDGTPPRSVKYDVRRPGQELVSEAGG
jgi:hypothetical protein